MFHHKNHKCNAYARVSDTILIDVFLFLSNQTSVFVWTNGLSSIAINNQMQPSFKDLYSYIIKGCYEILNNGTYLMISEKNNHSNTK